jgi:hypothetical protein
MPRLKARVRISIEDNQTGETIKVELIEQLWSGRFAIRQNGKVPDRHTRKSFNDIRTVAALDGRQSPQGGRPDS